ncbi:MAG: hypothetical protein GXP35_05660, partial [Actinobacteria bacterium]|nr:hypothetical protein [Actinomycetota bacterium]
MNGRLLSRLARLSVGFTSFALVAASLVIVGVAEADELSAGGYLITTESGEVGAFGVGAPVASPEGTNVVSIVAADDGRSIWLLQADGVVNYSGPRAASAAIDTSSWEPNERATVLVADPDDNGHWIVTNLGRVHSFGSSAAVQGVESLALGAPIVSASASPAGGLYLLGGDGGIFSLGGATFHGSVPGILPGVSLNQPLVAIIATKGGYWLAAADGGVFGFGDATFRGSLPQLLPGV